MPSRPMYSPSHELGEGLHPLGFIACLLEQCTANARNPRRVYTPLGFMVYPLDQCTAQAMNWARVYPP